jgi:thiamine transporter ThiT
MKDTRKLTLSAMFLALGQVLPFVTGQIPEIGKMLSTMHYPIFLCAFFCGPKYAALIGFICPLLRGVLFGMPVLYPNGIAMAFELTAYGFITGTVYEMFKEKSLKAVLVSLVLGMLGGRAVWGIAEMILLGVFGNGFTLEMFIAGAFANAMIGIIAQIILIPLIVMAIPAGKKRSQPQE